MRIDPSKDAIQAHEKSSHSSLLSLMQPKKLLKTVIKASESPAGFGILALVGITAVFLYQTGAFEAASESLQSETPAAPIMAETAQASEIDKTKPEEPSLLSLSLRSGETLIEALLRQDVNSQSAHRAVAELSSVADMRRIRPGQEIRIKLLQEANTDGKTIEELRLRTAFDKEATVKRTGEAYQPSEEDIKTIQLTNLVEGTIEDSLYISAQKEGLPAPVIVNAIRLLSFDVDFEREIRTGDTYSVYYTRRYAPEFDDIEEGKILRINLGMQKRELEGTLYSDSEGSDYFDAEGNSTRRALMKTPVDKAVMTSSYGKRKHPVLGYTRMHKGVDFRAYTGTPIMAAGDGVIERANRYGSYGNYIRIRHNGNYQTAYAHLSKFGKGSKKGRRVKQGQIIGYSGATGRVTGAHLHYEVYYNGKSVNPMSLKLPSGRKLQGDDLNIFQAQRDTLIAQIGQTREAYSILASLEPAGRSTSRTAIGDN
ncbi:peptidase M23 [Kordiimonas sediminis]|uniref:Peptidase M23 n=1 Tax=Kordiimonas sediminis TaxID=1735581 RepID=A0A919E3D8_9PROT|nr:peptidoglycan DD-metalloendopeptidase family protein [Kordiimonas sediminis]GHF10329.1 peptidase M23 [Kordiimonas sediminis]